MNADNYLAVILAGGKGSRIYPLSDKYSKCTLPLCNRPLMDYHIDMLKEVGIKELIVLVGHNGYDVVSAMGNGERHGITITYVNQQERLGIAHAVAKLEQYIDRPFLLFLGDIYFDCDSLRPMFEEFEKGAASAVLATKHEMNREAIKRNFAIMLNEDGTVKRVIEKPRYISNDIKGCGLYLFDLHIFDAIRRTPRTAMRDEYEITDSIQIMIDDGFKVITSNIIKDDLNITFIEDLLAINLALLRKSGKNVLVGKNTSVDESLLENAIVGDSVTIQNNIRIVNSVVFSNSKIRSNETVANSVVAGDQIINCNAANHTTWRG